MSGYIDESIGRYSILDNDIITRPFNPQNLLRRTSERLTR